MFQNTPKVLEFFSHQLVGTQTLNIDVVIFPSVVVSFLQIVWFYCALEGLEQKIVESV